MSSRAAAPRAVVWAAAVGVALVSTPQRPSAQAVGVQWTNLIMATASGSAVQKSAGCNGCADAGATSLQTIISGDAVVDFTPVAGARLYAGLGSTTTASTDPALIDFAFSFWPDGGWDVRERNLYRTEGRFVAGDVFRVAVVSGRVTYYKNGAPVYSSTAAVTYPLVFDTSLIGSGAAVSAATITAQQTATQTATQTTTQTTTQKATQPVTITTTALPDGKVSETYTVTLKATGGNGTYRWTTAGGTLPPGLSLSEKGVISGIPSAGGSYAFTVRAADTAITTNFDDQPLTMFVLSSKQTVIVTTTSVPAARLGEPYSTVLSASGGSSQYVWTIASGALPAGLKLATNGVIGGTTTTGGRYDLTVRATDAIDTTQSGTQALTLSVLASAPPTAYDAISDRTARTKGPLPVLGPAGYRFTDPAFGSRMLRVTDGATRPGSLNASYRTPSGVHSNAWSADARHFYVTSTDGNTIPYAFDATNMTATRLPGTGDGGLTFRFFNEPTFSYITPGVLYGTYNGSGANLRSVDQFDMRTGIYTQLLNLDTLAPSLSGTYTGGLGASAGDRERIFAFFGGASQGKHFLLVWFEKDNPANRMVVNTATSTVDGVPTNIVLNFRIHAAAIDRSGRYVSIYPTGADLQAPRSAAQVYHWDTLANTFTASPVVETRSGGHDAYGYGYRVNQDCCTKSTWDAAQWQIRSLATPTATSDLISPVLQPKEVFLSDHPSWHHAQPVTMVPFLSATYRYGDNTTAWRAWDEELIAVQTEAAGTGATVWRFAHHRSRVAHDSDPLRASFWYMPRPNGSPDGRWALITSNWEKTLGTDPRGETGTAARQDVFLVELKGLASAPAAVTIMTSTLPGGTAGQPYAASLAASGGSGTYTWGLVAGALPSGLLLDAVTGRIAGTPAAAQTASFTVRASDAASANNFDDQALTITVAPAISGVTITTTELPEAKRDVPYSATLAASGGPAPFTWSLVSGSLPSGLSLDSATGTISGIPRAQGNWSLTVGVVDSSSPATSATQTLILRVRRK